MQPTTDQRSWLAAGLFFAFIFLLMVAYAYFENKKQGTSNGLQKVNTSHQNTNTFK